MTRPDLDTLVPPGRVLGPLVVAAGLELVAWCLALVPGALGPGWYGRSSLLVAVHAITLGLLATSVVGAGWQLVPVIVARPWRPRAAPWVNALLLGGLGLLLLGFARPGALGHLGAGLVAGALLLRSLLVLPALAAGQGRKTLRLWLIGAELWLWIGLGYGLALWAGRAGAPVLTDPVAGVGRHAALLLAGWAGGQVVGMGGLLLPMFAVSREPSPRALALAGAAWAAGLLLDWPVLWALGLAAGLVALAIRLVQGARLDAAMAQAGLGLVGLAAAALLGGARLIPADVGVAAALTLGLLPLLHGVAQRIVPFLGWTHAFGARLLRAPPASTLGAGRLAKVQLLLGLVGGLALTLGRALDHGAASGAGAVLLAASAALQLGFLTRAALLAALHARRGQALAGMEG